MIKKDKMLSRDNKKVSGKWLECMLNFYSLMGDDKTVSGEIVKLFQESLKNPDKDSKNT